MRGGKHRVGSGFLLKYYSSGLILRFARVVLLVGAGCLFYECDNDIQAFLLPSQDAETVPTIKA